MGLYQELCNLRANGELIDDYSAEGQEDLYLSKELDFDFDKYADGVLEKLYEIREGKTKILYRPRKLGKAIKNAILDEFLYARSERAEKKNLEVRDEILKNQNLNMITTAIMHFIFQSGPIKAMFTCRNRQLSEDDLRIINKFMINRLAYVFKLIIEDRWIEFDFLVRSIYEIYGHEWDEPEPDDGEGPGN
ncbi:MAG: hypothetical protein GX248_02830 [Peptococcaceae bacterium]|jgi:hypothetical protein|nr:hypothetical protein [Peptococcaceae bacterium]